ncbi:MAG: tyrosine-type recombinase/integrase [Actinobacteria bacterium]|nr:tyrosine-type recombinase/integrase [Actinomycetota bacterium]
MSALRRHLEDYLALRRSLGFKLGRAGLHLESFVGWLEQAGAQTVTVENALAWATAPADADPVYWRQRMAAVRPFARYLAPLVPGAEVPPPGLLPGPTSRRVVPYLYSGAEVSALIAAAAAISAPFRAATYQVLIGLLAVTGMRVGEAIALDRGDLDTAGGLLTVRDGKFGKSRQLPLHETAAEALAGYARLRDARGGRPAAPAFFTSLTGTRLIYQNVHFTFHELVKAAGLEPRSAACRPRVHDLRHTFAVTTLSRWYADGGDVAARLPLLSTWLGHADPSGAYWYLTGTPELLALAAARLAGPERGQR